MGKRGPKPKEKVKIKWSADFAYAIGLITTDGSLSKDGRHIDFTSADNEQIKNFINCLGVTGKIGVKDNGKGKKAFRFQFGDIVFYQFLESIGLFSAKSLTLGKVTVPHEFIFDFLRGHFDGDGCFYSYWDKRWKSSYMFYLEFISGSKKHVQWIQGILKNELGVLGFVTKPKTRGVFQLKYAKREALEIINKMYYDDSVVCLSRKYNKIKDVLEVERRQKTKNS